MTGRRRSIPVLVPALVAMAGVVACHGRSVPPPPPLPVAVGPPAIPDTQPAVNAPFFLGQNAFPAPLGSQSDFEPALTTVRADGGNTGVFDGPAPLGRAPVAGSGALSLQPPILWGRSDDFIAGCRTQLSPGVTKNCLAEVDASTLTIATQWRPPGQDLNVATAVLDDNFRVLVTTGQGHLLVVAPPDSGDGAFRVVRDIDLSSDLGAGQDLLEATSDADGNLWFVSGARAAVATPATSTVVGYVTPSGQVVTIGLPDQLVEAALAVDQDDVYLVTAPAGPADVADATGYLYDLTSATGTAAASAASGVVQTLWREGYDAGSGIKPGGVTRGSASAPMLLGSQFVAITDNADDQAHLLVFYRGDLSTIPARSTTTTAGAAPSTTSTTTSATKTVTTKTVTTPTSGPTTTVPSAVTDPRLVCTVGLFTPGDSAVTSAPIAYSSSQSSASSGSGVDSVLVANGLNALAALPSPSDDGPANSIDQVATGVTRVDIAPDGSSCQTVWTIPLALTSSPVLSTSTGLLYGYTQDPARAASGTYVWYFVAVSYQTGNIAWQQRAGAGSTKNNSRQPLILGANGVLYQSVPLGLVWMRDVGQRP